MREALEEECMKGGPSKGPSIGFGGAGGGGWGGGGSGRMAVRGWLEAWGWSIDGGVPGWSVEGHIELRGGWVSGGILLSA